MTSKELSKLIREFVRKEIEFQKEQIIKEIKAELFDSIISSKPPVQEKTSLTENINLVGDEEDADVIRKQLRSKFAQQLGMDTVSFNTENVNVASAPAKLPDTFNGGAIGEKHVDVMKAMNKDYGALMKKMGIG